MENGAHQAIQASGRLKKQEMIFWLERLCKPEFPHIDSSRRHLGSNTNHQDSMEKIIRLSPDALAPMLDADGS